jgi:hypothetical protein
MPPPYAYLKTPGVSCERIQFCGDSVMVSNLYELNPQALSATYPIDIAAVFHSNHITPPGSYPLATTTAKPPRSYHPTYGVDDD